MVSTSSRLNKRSRMIHEGSLGGVDEYHTRTKLILLK